MTCCGTQGYDSATDACCDGLEIYDKTSEVCCDLSTGYEIYEKLDCYECCNSANNPYSADCSGCST